MSLENDSPNLMLGKLWHFTKKSLNIPKGKSKIRKLDLLTLELTLENNSLRAQALGYTLRFSLFSLKVNIFPFSASILTFST